MYSFSVILCVGRIPHSLAELSLARSTAIISAQARTTDRNFLVACDPLQYLGLCSLTGICTAVRLDRLSLHSALCVCTSDNCAVQLSQCQIVSISWPSVKVGRLRMKPKVANVDGFHCMSVLYMAVMTSLLDGDCRSWEWQGSTSCSNGWPFRLLLVVIQNGTVQTTPPSSFTIYRHSHIHAVSCYTISDLCNS